MKKTIDTEELRRKAETKVASQLADVEACSEDLEPRRLLHELMVHKVELEMQNEELQSQAIASKEKLDLINTIIGNAPVGLLVFKESGHCVQTNPAAEVFVGTSSEQLLNLNFREMESYKKTGILADMEEALRKGVVIKHEIHTTNTFGKEVWYEGTISPFQDNGEKYILYLFDDILERKKAERAFQESEEKYRNLYEQAGHGIAVADVETGVILSCNSKLSEMTGWSPEEIIGKRQHFLHPGDFSETFKAHREENSGLLLEGQLLAKDGSLIDVEILASPLSCGKQNLIQSFFYDISLRKKLIEDYRRAAQLAALGTIAAGVAHEINNPIQGIINYATLLEKSPEKTDRVIDLSQRIFKEGERIAKITQDLLFYSKNNIFEKVISDINALTQSALSLIELKIKCQGIQIDVDLCVDPPMIQVHPQYFQQIIVNLVDNASDALRAKKMLIEDKVINLSTSLHETEQGRCICIEVYDNGIGMSETVQARAKEAFFSTKPSVQGTGLGLSIVHDILRKHNGELKIESVEGEYCKMKALFPVA